MLVPWSVGSSGAFGGGISKHVYNPPKKTRHFPKIFGDATHQMCFFLVALMNFSNDPS